MHLKGTSHPQRRGTKRDRGEFLKEMAANLNVEQLGCQGIGRREASGKYILGRKNSIVKA